jgi:hypothetical protein
MIEFEFEFLNSNFSLLGLSYFSAEEKINNNFIPFWELKIGLLFITLTIKKLSL